MGSNWALIRAVSAPSGASSGSNTATRSRDRLRRDDERRVAAARLHGGADDARARRPVRPPRRRGSARQARRPSRTSVSADGETHPDVRGDGGGGARRRAKTPEHPPRRAAAGGGPRRPPPRIAAEASSSSRAPRPIRLSIASSAIGDRRRGALEPHGGDRAEAVPRPRGQPSGGRQAGGRCATLETSNGVFRAFAIVAIATSSASAGRRIVRSVSGRGATFSVTSVSTDSVPKEPARSFIMS